MMHQIVLLAAMTATTGLFGGGRQGVLTRWRASYSQAPTVSQAPPMAYPTVNPVYQAQGQAPAPVYYQSNYYAPAAATASCPNGNCPKR